jgi:hypothetical protein
MAAVDSPAVPTLTSTSRHFLLFEADRNAGSLLRIRLPFTLGFLRTSSSLRRKSCAPRCSTRTKSCFSRTTSGMQRTSFRTLPKKITRVGIRLLMIEVLYAIRTFACRPPAHPGGLCRQEAFQGLNALHRHEHYNMRGQPHRFLITCAPFRHTHLITCCMCVESG